MKVVYLVGCAADSDDIIEVDSFLCRMEIRDTCLDENEISLTLNWGVAINVNT